MDAHKLYALRTFGEVSKGKWPALMLGVLGIEMCGKFSQLSVCARGFASATLWLCEGRHCTILLGCMMQVKWRCCLGAGYQRM